ncbi:MAG: efflux RND transporter periplasmic adaptor subunit [Alphaproteobacteria bacterium]
MKKSHVIALGVTVSIVVWMGSGMMFGSNDPAIVSKQDGADGAAKKIVVEVRKQTAKKIVSNVIAQGHVVPDRVVDLRVETSGAVHDILMKEGHAVKGGDLLAKIDMNDRKVKLDEANAKIAEAKSKYDSAKKLGKKGYTAESRVDETLSTLRAAQAVGKNISLDIEHTNIVSPFDGVIDTQHVEQGDYVSVGDKAFTIVDNDPLIVSVYIPQHEISNVQVGGRAEVAMVTGENKLGTIRFIAPRAEQTTRTFRMEIAIPNPDGLPSGTSATVRIPKKGVMAHFVSTALLTLDINGVIGVKTVDDNGIVSFHPVKIVSSNPSGVHITGLPDQATIIVNGQGFVVENDKVSFVEAKKGSVSLGQGANPPKGDELGGSNESD